jgi:hypothetical protein
VNQMAHLKSKATLVCLIKVYPPIHLKSKPPAWIPDVLCWPRPQLAQPSALLYRFGGLRYKRPGFRQQTAYLLLNLIQTG